MSKFALAILKTGVLSRDPFFSLRNVSFTALFACALALPLAANAQVSVWLQSPLPGPNPNNVLVYATATSASAVTGWIIYVDDVAVYTENTNGTATLSHTVTLANGRHILYARAWISGGSFGTSMTLLIQVGPPPKSSSVLPTPPANATVLTEMQNTTANWTDCSVCANGLNDTTNFAMFPFQSQPSMSGSSLEFYVGGLQWTNALFIDTMFETRTTTHFLWDFWVYQDPASTANAWTDEFDIWQVLSDKEFMIGSQCDFGDGYWDTFDSANNRWIENGIACPRWAPNTWHHIQWYVERISSTHYRYDTLVVDGQGYGINQTYAANSITWPNAVGVQFQLDQSANGAPLYEWVDNVKLTLW